MIRNGEFFFTCSKDKSYNLFKNWELNLQKFYQTSLNCLEVNENCTETYLGGDDGSINLFKAGETWEIDTCPITNIKLTSSERYLVVSAQKIYVLNPENGAKIKTFVMHQGQVTSLLCIPRPTDFGSESLLHTSAVPLKKISQAEPGLVNFSFFRERVEPESNEIQQTIITNNEEIEKVKQANSILYRLWVEHCT